MLWPGKKKALIQATVRKACSNKCTTKQAMMVGPAVPPNEQLDHGYSPAAGIRGGQL